MIKLVDRLVKEDVGMICCVDDENAGPTLDDMAAVVSLLMSFDSDQLTDLGKRYAEWQLLLAEIQAGIANDPLERSSTIEADLRDYCDERSWSDEKVIEFGNAAKDAVSGGHIGGTSVRLKEIFKNSPVDFRTYSFREWLSAAAEVVSKADQNHRVLLLVDERNENELDVDVDGIRLLADVFGKYSEKSDFIDCVVVTANCGIDQEVDESHAVFEKVSDLVKKAAGEGIGVSRPHAVFVLSKARLAAGKKANKIAMQFNVYFDRFRAARFTRHLTKASRDLLINALDEAIDSLYSIPLAALHGSVFVSSLEEGTTEIDTFLRLINIKQRFYLEREAYKNAQLSEAVQELREIPAQSLATYVFPEQLRELRSLEFERSGEHINSLYSPLACGDVFQFKGQDSKGNAILKMAILLGNPCDLTLRSEGLRQAVTGLLVPVERITVADLKARKSDSSPLAYTLESGHHPGDTAYIFRTNYAESIQLSILDLVTYSRDGNARFDPAAINAATPGLTLHQKAAIAQFKVDDELAHPQFQIFGMNMKPSKTSNLPKVKVGKRDFDYSLTYDIARVWRLNSDYAGAALGALARSISRPAFDHDFLNGWIRAGAPARAVNGEQQAA